MLFGEKYKAIIECLLFVSGEPISLEKIAEVAEIKHEDALAFIEELKREYSERGFNITELAGGYQFVTNPEHFLYIERLYKPQAQTLSQAAIETLAIIAYRQPVTRAEIELIRGVKVDGVVVTLLEKKLITEVGRKESPGRPILYGTGDYFLKFFGLNSLEDLPSVETFLASPS